MDRTTFETNAVRDGYAIREVSAPADELRPSHVHEFDARLMILEGAMTLIDGGAERSYGPGESFEVPRGSQHAERIGGAGARYLAARRHT